MARRKRAEVVPVPMPEALGDDDVRDRFRRLCVGCRVEVQPHSGLLLTCRTCLTTNNRKARR